MKIIKPILIVLVILAIIVTIFFTISNKQNMTTVIKGNIAQKALPIELNRFQDAECGMIIDSLEYASQVVSVDGKSWFFHDHGGMVKWLERSSLQRGFKIWVYAKDLKKWIDGEKAYYSRDEKTPMEYGFGAYSKKKRQYITFEEMKLYTLRGETMANPTIRKQILKDRDGDN